MINGEDKILYAFITEDLKETDLLKILENIDKNIASSVKFLRVESTNFKNVRFIIRNFSEEIPAKMQKWQLRIYLKFQQKF